ncbi:hypothetical protein, partial [Burkholderia cepacia]|uniref:hypothetical protein n=1 Tax=Burkholderia cepacia TaxID=292 RepID=UPI001C6148C6
HDLQGASGDLLSTLQGPSAMTLPPVLQQPVRPFRLRTPACSLQSTHSTEIGFGENLILMATFFIIDKSNI